MTSATNWITTFYCEGIEAWQPNKNEDVPPLRIGEGYLSSERTERFRILDIWYSTDSKGPFGWGRHVFLEDVSETADDRLGRTEPEYFGVKPKRHVGPPAPLLVPADSDEPNVMDMKF